jgi:hypothetical protein
VNGSGMQGCSSFSRVDIGASPEADDIANFRIVWVVGRSAWLWCHRETCGFTSLIGNVL